MAKQSLTRTANAKINLSLDLTGVLPDGYHAVNTVMQSVSLCDTVTVELCEAGIRLSCSDPAVPTDRRNTAFAAAAAFYDALGQTPAVGIHIEKRIPSQAGLGGGSADAAAVLRCLHALHGFVLSRETLLDIALRVGADVPFCFLGGTRLCLNKGEVTAPLPPFSAYVVVAKPEAGVSTAAAFKRFDAAPTLSHPKNEEFLFYMMRGAYDSAFSCAGNLFEQLTDVPEGDGIRKSMRENGAYYAAMSGSGSAFFGLFHTETAASRAADRLRELVPFVAVCRTTPEERE